MAAAPSIENVIRQLYCAGDTRRFNKHSDRLPLLLPYYQYNHHQWTISLSMAHFILRQTQIKWKIGGGCQVDG